MTFLFPTLRSFQCNIAFYIIFASSYNLYLNTKEFITSHYVVPNNMNLISQFHSGKLDRNFTGLLNLQRNSVLYRLDFLITEQRNGNKFGGKKFYKNE